MSFLFHHGNVALKILDLGYHRWKNAWEKKLAWEGEVWENPLQTLTTDILKSQLSVSQSATIFLKYFSTGSNVSQIFLGQQQFSKMFPIQSQPDQLVSHPATIRATSVPDDSTKA